MRRLVLDGGKIIAETMDPYLTSDPDHLAYHSMNRERGRMGGQIRMRVRYKKYRTPWFEYLFVSPSELKDLVARSGWQVEELISTGEGPNYVVVLGKA
jgi:hypothetical protein